MKRISRPWKATRSRRARIASLLAKYSEILFGLVAVGPFVIQPSMGSVWWGMCVAGLILTGVGSYWYSRNRTGEGGSRT